MGLFSGGAASLSNVSGGDIKGNVFKNNTATIGGAIYFSTNLPNLIENNSFADNNALSVTEGGGAIYVNDANNTTMENLSRTIWGQTLLNEAALSISENRSTEFSPFISPTFLRHGSIIKALVLF